MMFAMGLIFTGTSPLQSVFTCLFFTIKYWVEKYNLAFVYNKQYESKGILWKPTIRLMLITLYISQFMNVGYFSLRSRKYFIAGISFIAIQTGLLIALGMYRIGKSRQDKFEISLLEQGLNPLGGDDAANISKSSPEN